MRIRRNYGFPHTQLGTPITLSLYFSLGTHKDPKTSQSYSGTLDAPQHLHFVHVPELCGAHARRFDILPYSFADADRWRHQHVQHSCKALFRGSNDGLNSLANWVQHL